VRDACSSRALPCRVVLGVVPVQRIQHPYGARCQSRAHRNAAVQPAVLAIVAGLFAGLALSVGLNKVVAQRSLGNLNDPVVLVAVSVVLLVATMMAAAIPANRDASIQPAEAFRTD
jgi:hypothetical protein